MEAQTLVLSDKAQEFISEMKDDEGFDFLIEGMYDLMTELVRDENIGGKRNRLYINHLIDVIDLAKMLK